jgi:ribonuclease HI
VSHTAYFDGACSGNPGPMSIGFVVKHPSKDTTEYSMRIGEGTNNEAEYRALIALLDHLKTMDIADARIYGDSKLVVKQVNKQWKINHKHLQDLAEQVWNVMKGRPGWKLHWIPREQNPADAVAKR